jgi:alpha-L-rhamnosidase
MGKTAKIGISVLIFIFLIPMLLRAAVTVGNLRCEMLENPLGIDSRKPRFSWQIFAPGKRNIHQISYHILVASTKEQLENNVGDLWDSGKTDSNQSQWIEYAGKPLKSNTYYHWKVKVTTNKGETSWSEPALWSMGLLSENDWKSQWIGMDKAYPWDSETKFSRLSARYLRKEFTVEKKVKQAMVHIAGLGLYELYINGKKISDRVLSPAPTDYRKTILYNSFDITTLIQNNKNAIGVILGNGRFYTMRQAYKPYKINTFGYPKIRLTLIIDYEDNTKEVIGSDTSWKFTADGPIRSNNEYDGEEYDGRKELPGWNEIDYDDSAWENAQRVSIPTGTLRAQMIPPIKIVEKIAPISLTKLSADKYILDMGQNMVGWIRMKVKGEKGDSVKLRFAETLLPNGELDTRNLRDAKATDIYILKGEGEGGGEEEEEWAPRFVYHGFRYVEVTGYPGKITKENFIGEVVNDDIKAIGSFECSHPIINQILKNAYWGIRGNYKGMPIDCPQRNERQPWLGDRTMGSLGESFIFENIHLYSKWMNDIREAQREDGCIPDVAPPFWNYYTDNVTWPAAFVFAGDMIYTQFGDLLPVKRNYRAMKKWIKHIKKEYMTEDHIITRDKYGDWCVPPESPELIHSRDPKRQTDGKLLATAYYYKILGLMEKFALLQEKNKDAQYFASLAEKIKSGFNRKFFNQDSLFYGNNSATSNLLPLAFGMVPENYVPEIEKKIVDKIIKDHNAHICTGVIGSQWILKELAKMERADLAFLLASNDTYPSWGYMAKKGATTIWELWNGDTANPEMNSHNHVMLLGDFIPFCYQHLAGIKSDSEQVGFKKIIMNPSFDIQELSCVNASYQTPYGDVKSQWKKNFSHLEWNISVPPNSRAVVHFPDNSSRINEGDKPIKQVEGIRQPNVKNPNIWEIGSGEYTFSVNLDVGKGEWREGIEEEEFLYEKAPFPECHAATIAETPKGLVVAFFGGTKERNPDCVIWVCRKTDKGWTSPQEVANGVINDTLRKACWNPVLYQIPDGELLLFYKIGNSVSDWTGHLIRSYDNGITWTKPENLPDGYIGPSKNKPIMIDKKLICPSSLEGSPGWRVHFEITEDKGRSWRRIGPINDAKNIQAIQPAILSYKDGSLQVLCRTRNRALAESWSKDQGETWNKMRLTNMPNNNSGIDAVTLKDGLQLLVYNHVKPPEGLAKGARTPLNVSLSNDGKNWYASLILEDSPISQYSYPSVIQDKGGFVHLVYTWRRQRIKYMKIDPKKLTATEIKNEMWPATKKSCRPSKDRHDK